MVTWETSESTDAAFNPLATTHAMEGATDFNSVGVKNYRSLDQGLDAARDTLQGGADSYGYDAILSSLQACATAEATAIGDQCVGLVPRMCRRHVHHRAAPDRARRLRLACGAVDPDRGLNVQGRARMWTVRTFATGARTCHDEPSWTRSPSSTPLRSSRPCPTVSMSASPEARREVLHAFAKSLPAPAERRRDPRRWARAALRHRHVGVHLHRPARHPAVDRPGVQPLARGRRLRRRRQRDRGMHR